MKPTRQLIDALRRAADRIAAPNSTYSWGYTDTCNCGIVACELLGVTRKELLRGMDGNAVWSDACKQTGLRLPSVVNNLYAAGLTQADIEHLENLSDATVRVRAGLSIASPRINPITEHSCYWDFSNPVVAIRYFRAQADILEEQLTPKPSPVPQPCVHLYLAGCCVYCSHVEPVTAPVKEQF